MDRKFMHHDVPRFSSQWGFTPLSYLTLSYRSNVVSGASIIAAHTLAPSVIRPPATMVLAMQDELSLQWRHIER